MSSYAVKEFNVGKAKAVETDLEEFLNQLAGEGWKIISVVTGLDTKGSGLVGNRPDSFLVIVERD